MKATNSGGNFKAVALPKPATVFCRCYSVIDIGTVPGFFQNKPQPPQRKVWITWELPSLQAVFNEDKGPQPFVVSVEQTASTSEKANLRILINRWRNKDLTPEEVQGFDPATMIGKVGFLSFAVVPKGKYKGQPISKITNENSVLKFNGIMPVPEGIERPKAINEYFNWDWDEIAEKGFDKDKFQKIPRFIQAKMATSQEFAKYAGGYSIDGGSIGAVDTDDNTTDDQAEQTITTIEGDW
jgi:hypothetical protein